MSQSTAELEARIAKLEERLRIAEDVQAIQRLKARYANLVDARCTREGLKSQGEIDEAARQVSLLFSPDGVWDGGPGLGVAEGREAIFERLRRPTLHFTWHFFLKPQIEVAGDTARGSWDVFAPCTTDRGRPMWMAGVEHDEYVRRAGEWLHRRMRLEMVFLAPHDRGWVPKQPDGGVAASGERD